MKDTKKVHMIDPPGGWKYGFPKVVPKTFENWEEEIDKMGEHFYCRHWEEVVE